ncbi:MAG: leucyl/phenylalanyl-tRNA--protein transferase [Desulfobacteraceae bacterium]|nr:MAG: leucyl/phenylalanyl-tRNA--protein transferase [Desulfobacteraceae bacterium]
MPVFMLSEEVAFPPPHLSTPEGLLAVGGDLSEERLLLAYRMGIFPWYSEGEPILWWSPDPRLVLYPAEFHLSRSLGRTLRKNVFEITMDRAFPEVIGACAGLRAERGEGTWIGPEMVAAYCRLHRAGFAHSVEVWAEGDLAGGLYGLSLGAGFFGESMFSRRKDASKAALAALVAHVQPLGLHFIDCQVTTGHLMRLGAREIPRRQYLRELKQALTAPTFAGCWRWEAPEGFAGARRRRGRP